MCRNTIIAVYSVNPQKRWTLYFRKNDVDCSKIYFTFVSILTAFLTDFDAVKNQKQSE